MSQFKLLIVDDNPHVVNSLKRALEGEFQVSYCHNEEEAKKEFLKEPDIVLLDINFNESNLHDKTGLHLLEEFLKANPNIPVVMITAYGDIPTAVECMKKGAYDYIPKPPNIEELKERLHRAIQNSQTQKKVQELEERLLKIDPLDMVGISPSIQEVKNLIEKISQDPYVTIMILG
ncbi:MAG: response regulator, partial [Planctomycetota bacterium]